MNSQTAVVSYQVATYSGEIEVSCHEDEDNSVIEARAKQRLTRQSGGSLPFGCCEFQVKERN
ncbi:hypothetical protein [Shewanella khirikhana]|uniref:Uncharacterized protein n=1 Tax=Shewanella khirikhana TaxID=1965282 RepID=A0ABM7DXL2_9GAMM|nr:hypothetical protein [Shewanella khirikhana]AZQ13305.1 hypothetical protein STH12_04279 [Shewanella khirikhana]